VTLGPDFRQDDVTGMAGGLTIRRRIIHQGLTIRG